MPKNWCFWTMVLEKTLESHLDSKEIQPVHTEGDQSWVFIGRTDAEAETPILWPPDAKNWLIGKDRDAGKDWRQEEKGTTEDRWLYDISNVMDMSLGSSRSWWWTGKPGVLQSMESQRVGHDWVTELTNWEVHLKAQQFLVRYIIKKLSNMYTRMLHRNVHSKIVWNRGKLQIT